MNRINLPSSSNNLSGLIAWLEDTRILLPLKSIDVSFNVSGDLAEVTLDQVFLQKAERAADVTYTFPLPAGAAVYRCELILNDRVVRARVEERRKARTILREMKAAGRRAALVEMERENLFTLSLGNVQPNDLIVIRFAWFQLLEGPGNTRSLSIPFTPGVRYVPGEPLLRSNCGKGAIDDTGEVPDASRISPPRIEALHPDASLVSISGTIDSRFVANKSVSSSSHPIIIREFNGLLGVALTLGGQVPDRDFVLRWIEAEVNSLRPEVLCCLNKDSCYAVARIDAPSDAPVSTEQARDYYFLIDRSGSMQGSKWRCTAAALQGFVRELGDADRVWATLFESSFQDFSEVPMLAREIEKNLAFIELPLLETGGGTELLSALHHVLKQIAIHSGQRSPVIVIITDGQIGNETSVLSSLEGHSELPIHTFGIDIAVNDSFLKAIAAQHHGTCVLMTPNDDIQAAVSSLARRLRRPVLTEIVIPTGWEEARGPVPDVHAEDHVHIVLKGPRHAKTLEIRGRLANGENHSFSFDLKPALIESPRLLWANQAIEKHLTSRNQSDAFALAIKHNLVCLGTAFIAYDEKKKVDIAREELYQPSLETSCSLEAMKTQRDTNSGSTCDACITGPSDSERQPSPRIIAPNRTAVRQPVQINNQTRDVSAMPLGYFILLAKKWEAEVSKLPLFQSLDGSSILKLLMDWVLEQPDERAASLVSTGYQFEPNEIKAVLKGFVSRHMAQTPQAYEILNLISQLNIDRSTLTPQ